MTAPGTRAPVPHRIDPRLGERRVAVIRAQGRRRLRIVLAVVSAATLLGIAWLVVQSPLLAVDRVVVRGAARSTTARVREVADVRRGTALLGVDTGAVARRVEQLPWVRSARVERDLPNALRITVVERVAAGWARRPAPAAGVAVLDAVGRVLADRPQPPGGLPELTGLAALPPPGGRAAPAVVAAVVARLPAPLGALVAGVAAGRSDVTLLLRAPPRGPAAAAREVRLGPPTDLHAKGEAALAVLGLLGAPVGYVDVRVPSAPATG